MVSYVIVICSPKEQTLLKLYIMIYIDQNNDHNKK